MNSKDLLWLALILFLFGNLVEGGYIKHQQRIIEALIELNHDKSVYIDSGCHGRYQGTEEMLPGEAKVLQ